MPFWKRSKEDDSPMPAPPVQIGWQERDYVRALARSHIGEVIDGGRVDGGRPDPLAELPERMALAVAEYMGSAEGQTYQFVLEHGKLPPVEAVEDRRSVADVRSEAFLRGR